MKEHKDITYNDAWKDPYNYYVDYCITWYLFLNNCKFLSIKEKLHKLLFMEELKRINKWLY
jgi:hypothetical protein